MHTVNLHYKTFGQGFPLIILHGLLGSLDNWQTIAKHLAEHFQVFILDQRNHGKSPHTAAFNYQLLADDLDHFMNTHQLSKAHVMGHSMGGKAAMLFALQHPEKVEKLVVVDIAPSAYDDGHREVFNAMRKADAPHAVSREQVQATLHRELPGQEATVQFLLKGLTRPQTGEGFEWKFNLDALETNYAAISGAIDAPTPFPGSVLFIKGEKSGYINASTYADMESLFPQHELTEIKQAGHWVHAEKPAPFTRAILNFLT